MKDRVMVEVWRCQCEIPDCPRKGEVWLSLGKRPPSVCPTCRSREWDGVKVKRKPARGPQVTLPKPIKVRQQDEEEFF
jgi:hypothetical protein